MERRRYWRGSSEGIEPDTALSFRLMESRLVSSHSVGNSGIFSRCSCRLEKHSMEQACHFGRLASLKMDRSFAFRFSSATWLCMFPQRSGGDNDCSPSAAL